MRQISINNYQFAIGSFIFFIAISCIAAVGGHGLLSLVASVVYCSATFFFLNIKTNTKERVIAVLIILAPVVLLNLPIHLLSYTATLASFPSLIAYFVGILFGVLMFYSPRIITFFFAVLLLSSGVYMYKTGYKLWLNKIYFGSYFLDINEPIPSGFVVNQNNGTKYDIRESNNKIVVMDFWNTGCGTCFNKFPLLQNKKNEYLKNSKISFYAVNVPMKRDSTGQGAQVFKSLKYTVPNLNTINVQAASNVGVNYFPTVLVIYHNRIIFRGDIEQVEECLKKIL